MQLLIDTPWCTYRDLYQCYISNLPYMSEIAIEQTSNRQISQCVKDLLINDSFNAKVKHNIAFLNPICTLINKFQDNKTSVSEESALWL